MLYSNNTPDEYYTIPLKSRHNLRQHNLKKKQVKYGGYHSNQKGIAVNSNVATQLANYTQMNQPPRHRILTESPGSGIRK